MPEFPFDITRLLEICRDAGVVRIGIIGSMARGDWTSESDIDLLVSFSPGKKVGLFELAHLKNSLSDAMGRKVDIATEGMLSPYLLDAVLNDLVIIYEDETLNFNPETIQAIDDAKNHRNLETFNTADELFDDLGI